MIVTLDLELGRAVSEAGGWAAAKAGLGGMACCVTMIDYPAEESQDTALETGHEGRVYLWDEHNAEELGGILQSADVVVTYNGKAFDLSVLQGVLGQQLHLARHYDVLSEIWTALGRMEKGWTLDDAGIRNLGRGKTGDGTHAPELAAQGRWAELFQYCLEDVRLTRDLFRGILKDGGLLGPDDVFLHIPPPWMEVCDV